MVDIAAGNRRKFGIQLSLTVEFQQIFRCIVGMRRQLFHMLEIHHFLNLHFEHQAATGAAGEHRNPLVKPWLQRRNIRTGFFHRLIQIPLAD